MRREITFKRKTLSYRYTYGTNTYISINTPTNGKIPSKSTGKGAFTGA